jgi:hypothetical protein
MGVWPSRSFGEDGRPYKPNDMSAAWALLQTWDDIGHRRLDD